LSRFFLALAFVSACLVGIAFGLKSIQWIDGLPSYFFQTLIFLLFGTSLLYAYLYKFNRTDFFVQLYLLSMAVKLIAYGTYNFILIEDDKPGAVGNVGWFLVLYFIFTALEIFFLYKKIAKQ
jgi:hypothetical protein